VPSTWDKDAPITLSWQSSSDFRICRLYFPDYLFDGKSPVIVVNPVDSKTFGSNRNVSSGQKALGLRCFNEVEYDHVYDYKRLDYWNPGGTYPSTRPNYEQWGTPALSVTVTVVD
jgi:hypothetical protein